MTIRKKTTVCGDGKEYLHVELFPLADFPKRKCRRNRYRETSPAQRELNDKHAKKYFQRLAECNFGRDDWFLTLTYDNGHLPEGTGDAEHNWELFIRRVKRLAKKRGGKVLFLAVQEKSGKGRFHHHALINKECGLSREEIEACWKDGWCECKPIWENRERNIARLSKYMTKNMTGTRRWKSSRGLKKPKVYINDSAISGKRYRELSLFKELSAPCRERWEKLYPGYEVIEYENYLNPEYGGCYIRVELRRCENNEPEKGKTKIKKHQKHSAGD